MVAPQYAFVTLITSDHYLPGALVLAAALKDVHKSPPESPDELDPSEFQRVCLVTPETVNVNTIKQLRKAFDVVVGVEVIEQGDEEGLALLGRLDLTNVLTKLHVFRLTSYRKVIFLDADMLPLQPISHLFHLNSAFAAVPDVGWPDIFNSGFFVTEPAEEKFDGVRELAKTKGSWDGGDQGVLNEWIGSNWERLSFTYNTTPTAAYTYAPAYKRFGAQIKNIHFIGPNKPWNSIPFRRPGEKSKSSPEDTTAPSYDFGSLLDRWFEVYDRHCRPENVPDVAFSKMEEDVTSRRYLNAWGVSQDQPPSMPLGLEELRRLAIEGTAQAEAGSDTGEATYRTLPLEGRVDLMRPTKVVAASEAPAQSSQVIRIIVPESPHTPRRASSHMTTLPTPGPDELPPAPHFRGQSLPPETPTYAGSSRPLFDTPTHSHLQVPQRTHSPSPLSKPSSPPSPPLLLWNPAVEAPPTTVSSTPSFPMDTFYPNAWDVPSQEQHEVQAPGLFAIPRPPPIPEQLLREGHYKDVIGEMPPKYQHTKSHVFHEDQPSTLGGGGAKPENTHRSVQAEPTKPSPKSSAMATLQPQQVQDHTKLKVSSVDPHGEARHVHGQSTHRHIKPFDIHEPPHRAESPKPSYPQPDRRKVTAVFPWEQKPRRAPQRFYPRTDSPPPVPFTDERPSLKVDIKPQAVQVSPSAANFSAGGGFPRTTSYANAWDSVPSIQRYASRLIRPPVPVAQPTPQPRSGRSRKGSGADTTLDDYRRRQEIEDINSHDADDEDEDDDEKSVGGESDQAIGPSRLPPQPTKKYKVKGVQTITKTMKDQSVQVNIKVPGRHRSRSLSGKTTDSHVRGRRLSLREQEPSPEVPSVISERTSTRNDVSVAPLSSVVSSPLESTTVLHPPSIHASILKPRPPGRKFDPAREVDVFKRGSEEVLARFLQMDSWGEEQHVPEVPPAGTPSTVNY